MGFYVNKTNQIYNISLLMKIVLLAAIKLLLKQKTITKLLHKVQLQLTNALLLNFVCNV